MAKATKRGAHASQARPGTGPQGLRKQSNCVGGTCTWYGFTGPRLHSACVKDRLLIKVLADAEFKTQWLCTLLC